MNTIIEQKTEPTMNNIAVQSDPEPKEIASSQPNSGGTPRRILPFYYDQESNKDYFIPDSRNGYVRVRQSTVRALLARLGYLLKPKKGEVLSEVEEELISIQTEHSVDYVGSLAGYKAGYYPKIRALVTSSPTFIAPCPGKWPVLKKLMENLFGDEQLPYVYGWLKVALQQYQLQMPLPGQAFVMCGEAGSGKNLFRLLISILLGGEDRVRHPYQFMTGGTTFNADIFGGETLAIEDESESKRIGARKNFGAHIKMIVANQDQRHHRKYGNPVTLRPLWRLIISLNDNPERLLVLPPMDDDIADKIMLFKVEKHDMPMPTNTPEQKAAFKSALVAELPAFVDFLDKWEISDAHSSPRFGVKHYHHPELHKALDETAPEFKLLEMIDETIFDLSPFCKDWEGKSEVLGRELKGKDSPCAYEARKLLENPGRCGVYLGRLQNKMPDRVSSRIVNGRTIWTIAKPLDFGGKQQPAVPPAIMQMLLDRERNNSQPDPEPTATAA